MRFGSRGFAGAPKNWPSWSLARPQSRGSWRSSGGPATRRSSSHRGSRSGRSASRRKRRPPWPESPRSTSSWRRLRCSTSRVEIAAARIRTWEPLRDETLNLAPFPSLATAARAGSLADVEKDSRGWESYMAASAILAPMAFERLAFDAETHLADVRMFQQEAFGAIYLIDDERKAIVETGTSWDAGRILDAVRSFGLRPADIDALIVSHIHLDHAGGAGFLLEEMSRAQVYVHERGFKHLADPTRLLASAREALGPEESQAFGTMRPIPADRLVAVKEGDRLELGKHALRFLDSPGHAPHELTILDERTRCMYTGDAAGGEGIARLERPGRRFAATVRHELPRGEAVPAGVPRAADPHEHHGPRGVPRADGTCCPCPLRRRSAGSRRTGRAERRSSRASLWR